jgi:tRNA(Ile)-lysidine synthase TilS/MesJ
MDIRKASKPSHKKWFLSDVIRAVNTYGLIKPGEEICVALSGGRDSTTLLFILWYLRTHSHLEFDLCALHVRTDDYDTGCLRDLCAELGVKYLERRLKEMKRVPAKNVCAVCARLKRGAMTEALRGTGVTKVAFGHHASDAAETLLMNIIYNRKLGSFSPKVEVPEGGIVIIRPLVYLDGPLVRRLHAYFGLPCLPYACPHADKGARATVRGVIAHIEEIGEAKDFPRMVVGALENVDMSSLWADMRIV